MLHVVEPSIHVRVEGSIDVLLYVFLVELKITWAFLIPLEESLQLEFTIQIHQFLILKYFKYSNYSRCKQSLQYHLLFNFR
jgi:hypothetical protein